jgi:hypothetical protein
MQQPNETCYDHQRGSSRLTLPNHELIAFPVRLLVLRQKLYWDGSVNGVFLKFIFGDLVMQSPQKHGKRKCGQAQQPPERCSSTSAERIHRTSQASINEEVYIITMLACALSSSLVMVPFESWLWALAS